MEINQITEKVIGAAIEVHRELGPGLLESAYEECLLYELETRKLSVSRQVPLPVIYKGHSLECPHLEKGNSSTCTKSPKLLTI